MNEDAANVANHLLNPLATIPAVQRSTGDADWFPPVDILEDAEEYLFKIDLPEVRAEDVRVVVEKNRLLISGKRPEPWEENKTWMRSERPRGHFERSFALPENASREGIESFFENSVLELHVHKFKPLAPDPPAARTRPKLKLAAPQSPGSEER